MLGIIAGCLLALKIAGLGTIATSTVVIWILVALLVNIIVVFINKR